MSLVQLNDLSIAYSGPPLFDEVECRIEAKQRIGLLGRNGAGKTTLMRLIVGQEQPDSGTLITDPGTNITLLPPRRNRMRCLTSAYSKKTNASGQGLRPAGPGMKVAFAH